MIMLRERRGSRHRLQRRRSLADCIDDFPTLDYVEKPEFRMPEVMCIVRNFLAWGFREFYAILAIGMC